MSSLRGNGFQFKLGRCTYIMGVLNITPDSFYDGGRYNTLDRASMHALQLERDGADVIDVGANSTRPSADILSAGEELAIMRNMLPAIINTVSVPVSVDTFYPEVARFALENGARIINDVSGRINPDMNALVREYNAGLVVMHNPAFSSSKAADYSASGGVVSDIRAFFENACEQLDAAGINREQIMLDVGIGFSKTREDDVEVLRNLRQLKANDTALLVALSNKRMTDVIPEISMTERLYSTVAADTLAIASGADFLRVHNVREAKIAAVMADRIVR